MEAVFKIKDNNYDLRQADSPVSNKPISTTYGIGSIANLAPNIWEQIPADIKCYKTIKLYRNKIKTDIPASFARYANMTICNQNISIEFVKDPSSYIVYNS